MFPDGLPSPCRPACPMSARKLRAKEMHVVIVDPDPSWLSTPHTEIGREMDN